MSSSLVLGLGNRLSGADAFGPAVIDRLRDESLRPGVTIVDAGTDLLGWIGRFAEYDRIVLVDAVAVESAADAPAAPPCVAIVGEAVVSEWNARSPGVHEISPLVALRLFRALHGGTPGPVIHLVGLFVTETDFSRRPEITEVALGVAAVRRLANGGADVSETPVHG